MDESLMVQNEAQLNVLRRMINAPSPSGFEQPMQQVVREVVSNYTDEVRPDVHGNVIAALNPSGHPRVMLTAHCDEIGFLVRYIDDQGFLYFATIGGYAPATLPGDRVYVYAPSGPILGVVGYKPVHLMSGEERGKAPKISELWIDIGTSSREEAQQLVPIGTVATRADSLERMRDNLVVSRALDDKAGVLAVIEAMRRLSEQRVTLKAGVFFVSAVQEEVGSRGATTSAYGIEPQIAIAVDAIPTSDHPLTSKHETGEVKLNGGPAITVGGYVNPRVYSLLVHAANEAGIAYQIDPQASCTGTDTDMIQVARSGVATGLVSIPLRYMHTGSEIVSLKDVDEVAELLARFVLAVNEETNVIP